MQKIATIMNLTKNATLITHMGHGLHCCSKDTVGGWLHKCNQCQQWTCENGENIIWWDMQQVHVPEPFST